MDEIVGKRIEYATPGLDKEDLLDDPFELLRRWLEAAEQAGEIEPSAMCLATVSREHWPNARMVLVRGVDPTGVTFFTNYQSDKAVELESTGVAAGTFYWPSTHRQVRLKGAVSRVPEEVSDEYFASRPYESQLASAASHQSAIIDNMSTIEEAIEKLRVLHPHSVPRPLTWGGYKISVEMFEFWQGQPSRLHDRFRYTRTGADWIIQRLAP